MKATLFAIMLAVFVAAAPPNANNSSHPANVARAVDLLAEISEVMNCDYQCALNCQIEGEHHIYEEDLGNDESTQPGGHNCLELEQGCDPHICSEEASLELDDFVDLENILRTASPLELSAIVASSENLEVNYDRQSLQVIGCDGFVVVSVPRDQETILALSAD